MTWETENGSATVHIVGAGVDREAKIDSGANFADTMKELARSEGAKRFRVYDQDGDEIEPSTAPSTLSSGDYYKIRIEDKAAI